MKTIAILGCVTITLVLVGWLGLQIKPKPFSSYQSVAADPKTNPLPDDLPVPVKRFYNLVYGDTVPIIETVVISGRGSMRVKGITFPIRFRFTHIPGQDYHHYIEATIFGLPLMKVNEWYVDGKSRLELPFGVSEGAKVDQGANLALWAEAIWMPSVWITNPQVCWEPIDERTAQMIVPFGEKEEHITVRFDPSTGMLRTMESMRFKESDSNEKTLWINEVVEWASLNGRMIPVNTAITWNDEGTPWAVFTTEEVIYNADIHAAALVGSD